MRRTVVAALSAVVLTAYLTAPCQTVKRGREEGTSCIGASNVMGNGNITALVTGGGGYTLDGFMLEPTVGGRVGVTDIMQLSAQMVPISSRGIGTIEAHVQVTTPANDKLRFFGIALFADLYLSTMQDTLGQATAKEKPEYNSYPSASVVMDLDWLAVKRWLPLKLYLRAGMDDNPDLLYKYNQIALSGAIEWKMYEHSTFINAGISMYKEKAFPAKGVYGDSWYGQKYAWVEPGARYRLWSRVSLIGSVKLTLYQDVKEKNPLKPELFNASLRCEVPIFFKETNTEAIRTLVFMERRREKTVETATPGVPAGENLLRDVSALSDEDSLSSFDFTRERENLIKRREETQKKMNEIEKMFEEIDRADSLKRQGMAPVAPPAAPPETKKQ
jgi:hypothetical protein